MTDIRRTTVWVIFIISLIMLWDQWQIYNGRQPLLFPSANNTQQAQTTSGTAPTDNGTLQAGHTAVVNNGGTPNMETGNAAAQTGENITITTDEYRITFNTIGAKIIELELLNEASTENKDEPFKLVNPAYDYEIRSGVINAQNTGTLPDHNTLTHMVSTSRAMAEGQDHFQVVFESEPVNGVVVTKTYEFTRGSYVINVIVDIKNQGTQPVTPQIYYQLVRNADALPGGNRWFGGNTFTGFAYYNGSDYEKVAFSDIKNTQDLATSNSGWIAMVQHYFVSAWLPDGDVQREIITMPAGTGRYAIAMKIPQATIQPGETITQTIRLYSGPQYEKVLEELAPKFELVKDYGIFRILSKPLFWLLYFLHGIFNNWGWAIVGLVVLIKAAFFWLNARAYKSMAKMRALGPRLQELNERYKDDPQQKQQETMRIYREEKINPLGGCLPILIQIPVFIALYWVLLSSVEMRDAPWILWITDLSVKDPYYILPAIMAASTMLQTWLNPKPADPMQARMMWIMPLMFSVLFFMFPAGLVLYWVTNNLLSIAQQWFINNKLMPKN